MAVAATDIRTLVQHRVGAFFRNCLTVDVCPVCYGPTAGALWSSLCEDCERHRYQFGPRLADATVMLTYAQGWMPEKHQSAHVVRAYKDLGDIRALQDMNLVLLAARLLHHDCLRARVGRAWNAIAFVPSRRQPHPIRSLAEILIFDQPTMAHLELDPGPGFDLAARTVREDRFLLSDRGAVRGRDVLLVEDTWVSGAKLQSAAVALKDAGARHVTGFSIARWLSWRNDAHQPFIASRLSGAYDPAVCPAARADCPHQLR